MPDHGEAGTAAAGPGVEAGTAAPGPGVEARTAAPGPGVEARTAAAGPGVTGRLRLFDLLSSPWLAQSCYALAKLGIPDLMAAGPRPVAELAAASGTDVRALHRILRALAAAGLMHEIAPGTFGLTELTQLLRSDLPRSSRDAAIMFGEEVFQSFAEITYTLRTGRPAFEKVYGQRFYDYLAVNPDAARTFSTAMGGAGVPAVVSDCDFGGLRTVVDVGGGDGGLLSRVLRAHPQARGVLVDLPAAVAQARERLARAGFTDRVDFVEESFFDVMPDGGDVYVLCRVLHNWPDEECVRLLRRIRQAMRPGGRVIVIEDLLQSRVTEPERQRQAEPGSQPRGSQPQGGQVMDLLILLMLPGRDRGEAEYGELLGRAGFAVQAVRPPRGRSAESAIEATGGRNAARPPGSGDPRPA